jgi:hypothetical protein
MDSYSISSSVYTGPTSWPEVVGLDAWRAKRIIRWGNYLHVLTRPIKKTIPLRDSDTDSFTSEAGNRVILYLDKDGYVARTPVLG